MLKWRTWNKTVLLGCLILITYSRDAGRKPMAKVRSKLKELLQAKKSSQLVGRQSCPDRSQEPMAATPCSCRTKEIKPIRRLSQEDSKGDTLNKLSNKPRNVTCRPNLKKTKSDDDLAKGKSPHHHSDNVKKSRRHPTKAQILRDAKLDADEWSVIDLDSPKHGSKCFGC